MSIADKLTTIAENEQRVFEAGMSKAESDFWDAYQQNGTRTNYQGGFMGRGWSSVTFKPKHNLHLRDSAREMFRNINDGNEIFDFAQRLEDCGVTLDTSKANDLIGMFRNANISSLPTISCEGTSLSLEYTFAYTKIVRIEKLILKASNTYNTTFYQSYDLEEVNVEGVIGNGGIGLANAEKLTKPSIMSFLYALEDKTSVGGTWKLGLGTANQAKLTDAEKAIATQKGWTLT